MKEIEKVLREIATESRRPEEVSLHIVVQDNRNHDAFVRRYETTEAMLARSNSEHIVSNILEQNLISALNGWRQECYNE